MQEHTTFMKPVVFDRHGWSHAKHLVDEQGWRILTIQLMPPPARNVDIPPTQQKERFQQKPT